MIIEQVSGERWADYVDRNIFKPLGMLASSVDKKVAGLAVPYGRRVPDGSREGLPFVDARGMAAATGVTSNLEDMAKFVSAQFRRGPRGGAQVVSTGSLREMHRVRMLENDWTRGPCVGGVFVASAPEAGHVSVCVGWFGLGVEVASVPRPPPN